MTLDKFLVLIIGALGIGFTYWFFLSGKMDNNNTHDHEHNH
jgi:Tfp pilus assembly protein PilO